MVRHCPECVVDVHPAHATCPLCGAPLHPEGNLSELYPPAGEEAAKLRKQQRVFNAVSISFAVPSAVCLFLNLILDSSVLWSMYVIGGFAVAWLLIFLPPRAPRPRTRYVVLLVTVCASGYMAMVSIVSATPSWYLDWVFPFLVAGAEVVMLLFLLIQKAPLRRGYGPVLWMLLLSLAPLVAGLLFRLNAEGAPKALWPAIIAAGMAVIGMILGFIAARSWWRGEVRRKFHI